MSKVTKWAVETAKESMNDTIRLKMANWDKVNPAKARGLNRREMAEIAVEDPAWKKHVIERARRGHYDVDIRDSDFEACSPLVAAAVKKNEAIDATRNKARAAYEGDLLNLRDEICRSAIIGDMESVDLLKAVNAFCKR